MKTLEEHIADVFGSVLLLVKAAEDKVDAEWREKIERPRLYQEARDRLERHRVEVGRLGDGDEPLTYGPESEHSYFRDLARVTMDARSAGAMTPNEVRQAAGVGSSFIPPKWLEDAYHETKANVDEVAHHRRATVNLDGVPNHHVVTLTNGKWETKDGGETYERVTR